MNNLVFDINKRIKIPQNKNSFFIIEECVEWKYSIIIKFNYIEEVDYTNLFLIIKSYVMNKELSPYSLCTVFRKNNQNIVSQNQKIRWFVDMDFYSFIEWIEYRIKNDNKYKVDESFIGITILFPKGLVQIKSKNLNTTSLLQNLKPEYPWKIEWINHFKQSLNTIQALQKKIEYYEHKEKEGWKTKK